jgi:hypothetical protein
LNYPVYEVSYRKDELHTKELLACRSYLIFQGPGPAISLGLVVLAVSAAYFFKIPLSGIQLLFLGIWFIATPYLKGAVDVWRSTRAHETFKTSLSARGVSDETTRRGAVIPWSLISSIRYENGNVYFISWLGGVFVPAYAFQTEASAREFLSIAEKLWNDAKQPKKIKAR